MLETFWKVWTKILEGEPTLWAGILGGVIGVGGAIIAGWLSGRISGNKAVDAALEGARRAHADNLDRDKAARVERAVAFVQAVQAEMEANFIAVAREIAPAVRRISANQPMMALFPVSASYFSVFEASADRLGDIDDGEVRKSIIKTYGAARAILDTISYNNQLLERYWEAERANDIVGGQNVFAALCSYSNGVVRYWQEVESQLDGFWEKTNLWLRLHGSSENPRPQIISPDGLAAPEVSASSVDHGTPGGAGAWDSAVFGSPGIQSVPPTKPP